MVFFKEKKDNQMIANLISSNDRPNMVSKLTVLQNEISVSFNTNVLVITSFGEDKLAAAFGKALADTYASNNSNYLLIDANLYDPCLASLLGEATPASTNHKEGKESPLMVKDLGNGNGVLFMGKEIYPSDVYKSGVIHNLINESKEKYEHIIVLAPSIKEHKEVVLFKDVLDSVLLVARRDGTKKKEVYNSLVYLAEQQIPVSKTVILK